MSAHTTNDWIAFNQRRLARELERVKALLEKHAASADRHDPTAESDTCTSAPSPVPDDGRAWLSALDILCARFGLSPFERDVLLLCAGVEFQADFAAACGAAQGNGRRGQPTFALALAALEDAHWSALAPQAPLRFWRLIEPSQGATLVTSPLAIDERILHYLAGVAALDSRLAPLARPMRPPTWPLPASHRAAVERLCAVWSEPSGELPLVRVGGDDLRGARAVAATACATLGSRLLEVRGADVPSAPAERSLLARLLTRERALSGAAVWLDAGDAAAATTLAAFLDEVDSPVITTAALPSTRGRRVAVIEVRRPAGAEQLALWRGVLSEPECGRCAPDDSQLERITGQFWLSPGEMADAARDASLPAAVAEPSDGTLWRACRLRARGGLDELATRIELRADWDDLVLPPAQLAVLRDIARQVRNRAKVYDTWGFAAKSQRGLGISALFVGESGTGKTLAAEVLARDLELDLYRIDLSAVVSKYIGETEKNLRRVFDAAETSGAVLLFDEADAFFGKRSEVRDSHDRYANVEIAYLLQRMEAYRGLAILTTNMRAALDKAFLRRIRFVVQFPFPDEASRAEIWRRIFPAATPIRGLDPARAAKLGVAGGNIRNIALNAAFLAAEDGGPVLPAHVLRAARAEYAKLEKPLTDAEVGGWA